MYCSNCGAKVNEGAGTWQRVGDGVYEIMLDGASSKGTIRLPS